MGVLPQPYTKEYYHHRNAELRNREASSAEADACDEPWVLGKREEAILQKIDFRNASVLCMGCGVGTEMAYALGQGARTCAGVDFSADAIELAQETLAPYREAKASFSLVCQDILAFALEYQTQVAEGKASRFNVVLALGFLERVPRGECESLLRALHSLLGERAVLVVDTPAYPYDNDVLKDGVDERNLLDCLDTALLDPETAGMVCNRLTPVSLLTFLEDCGYRNVTEAHYFIACGPEDGDFGKVSYLQRWRRACEQGYPLRGAYSDDAVDVPYQNRPDVQPHRFEEGELSGITLCTTPEYIRIAYADGNIDMEAIDDLKQMIVHQQDVVVLDVGGFVGANAIVYAKLIGDAGRVIVFEPNPYNRNRIFTNLSHNPAYEGRISVEKVALGSRNGECEMTLSANIDLGYSSTSRIEESHSTIATDKLPLGFFSYRVPVATLDSYLEETKLRPSVIKIDIEGAETMMLQGSVQTLRQARPICYIEYHSQYCATECTQILMNLGYLIVPCKEEPDNRLIVKAVFQAEKALSVQDLLTVNLGQTEHIGLLVRSQQELLPKIEQIRALQEKNASLLEGSAQIVRHSLELEGALANLLERFTALEGEKENLSQQKVGLEGEKNNLAQQAGSLEQSLSELLTRFSQLEADKESLTQRNASQQQSLEVLCAENAALREELQSLFGSHSWKITRPLRFFRQRLKEKR